MVSNHIMLVLFYGEIWVLFSTETPSNVSMSERNVYTSTRSPTEDRSTTYQLQTTGPSLQRSGRALTALTTQPYMHEIYIEPSNGSWLAALVIGIILVSMIVAIMLIILWKCCKRPLLVDSNWAGRSPFADGDTPDVFMDSGQATKHLSVLSMLPWKLGEDTRLRHDPAASEKPSNCTTSNENSQTSPTVEDCSVTTISVSNAAAPPPPISEAASCARASCPHPPSLSESSDLPPPPDWLREPTEDHCADPRKQEELHSEIKEQFPPPPKLII
ncbi:EVI2B protein, partial [Chauna torquata]|nr:EVI2B protein [Chauna torquata]